MIGCQCGGCDGIGGGGGRLGTRWRFAMATETEHGAKTAKEQVARLLLALPHFAFVVQVRLVRIGPANGRRR